MKKTWAVRNKERIDEALELLGAESEEQKSAPESIGHQIVTYYHRRSGKGSNEPTGGVAMYYVCRVDRQHGSVMLMDVLLNTYNLSRRAFEEGLTAVYWPEEQRTDLSGTHCDPLKLADQFEKQAKTFADMGRNFDQLLVRRSIAELRDTTLDKIPKFKTKTTQGEKEMPDYMKRAKALADEWDEDEVEETPRKKKTRAVADDDDEDETPTPKKSTTKKTAAKAARNNESEGKVKASKNGKNGNVKAKTSRSSSEHETPKVGTVFEANFHGKTHTMKVAKQDGEIVYVVGKKSYNSPSSAGKAVTGSACNGWKFWHID